MLVEQFHDLIDQVILNKGGLFMDYCNNHGIRSLRVVEPRRWENYNVFTAYCHLRKEERQFKLSNILSCQSFTSVEAALDYLAKKQNNGDTINSSPKSEVKVEEKAVEVNRIDSNNQFIQQTENEKGEQELIQGRVNLTLNHNNEELLNSHVKAPKRYVGMTFKQIIILYLLILLLLILVGIGGFYLYQDPAWDSILLPAITQVLENNALVIVTVIIISVVLLSSVFFVIMGILGISRKNKTRVTIKPGEDKSSPSFSYNNSMINQKEPFKLCHWLGISDGTQGYSKYNYPPLNHGKPIRVRSYRKRDGTYVRTHTRNYRRW